MFLFDLPDERTRLSKPQILKHIRLCECTGLKVFVGVLILTRGKGGGIQWMNPGHMYTCICVHKAWMYMHHYLIGLPGRYFLAHFVFVSYHQHYISWTVHILPVSYVENICLPWRPPTQSRRGRLITQLEGLGQCDIQKSSQIIPTMGSHAFRGLHSGALPLC